MITKQYIVVKISISKLVAENFGRIQVKIPWRNCLQNFRTQNRFYRLALMRVASSSSKHLVGGCVPNTVKIYTVWRFVFLFFSSESTKQKRNKYYTTGSVYHTDEMKASIQGSNILILYSRFPATFSQYYNNTFTSFARPIQVFEALWIL